MSRKAKKSEAASLLWFPSHTATSDVTIKKKSHGSIQFDTLVSRFDTFPI